MAEVHNNGSNGNITNYNVSGKAGKIYHSSKEPKDGYQEIVMQNGGKTYHRYVDGISGIVGYIGRIKKEFIQEGKTKKLDNLSIILKDADGSYALGLPTFSQEWKLLIKSLYNADFNKLLQISFYKKKAKDSDKDYLNCFVSYPDFKNEEGKNTSPEWLNTDTVNKGGVVPDPVKNAKDEWDWTENDIWYLTKLEEIITRFTDGKVAQPTMESKISKSIVPKATPQESFSTDDDQDLPF